MFSRVSLASPCFVISSLIKTDQELGGQRTPQRSHQKPAQLLPPPRNYDGKIAHSCVQRGQEKVTK
jgi:hypothetical protein